MTLEMDDRTLDEELWLTIKLEWGEEEPAPKSSAVFGYCTKTLVSLFHRGAYLWFLAISVLELIADDRDLRMTVPFLFLLLLAVALRIYHWHRELKTQEQTSQYRVWSGDKLEDKPAKSMHTGDILCLNTGDQFPADVLVLASGRSDQNALVDAFPYYGKPMLRMKQAISETQRIIRSCQFEEAITRMTRLRGIVRVTQPIADIGFFRGQIKLSGYVTASALSLDNLCLKGSRLCCTPWVIGLVAYAGADCKCEMNRTSTKREKLSKLEAALNRFLVYYVIVIIALGALSAGLQTALAYSSISFWSIFRVSVLLYSQAVPASLYVLLDLARVTHILFFCADLINDPAQLWPHNLRMAEALGEVEYVLTDKTGTLTESEVTLKTVRVGLADYTRCSLPQELHKHLCLVQTPRSTEGQFMCRNTPVDAHADLREEEEEACGFTELRAIVTRSRASLHTRFCESVALCNAVEVTPEQEMTSQSPLELALLTGALELGVVIHSKGTTFCSLTIGELRKNYSILAVSDFKPTLRRMRVLVQRQETQEGLLIVKGALDSMRNLVLFEANEAESLDFRTAELTRKRLTLFVYAFKSFSASEMATISDKLEYLQEVDSKGRKRENFFRDLEKESTYIGLAAVEDPILPQTVKAVNALLESNIRVWVLSGDREASTVAAAAEVGLLPPFLRVASISNLDHESVCSLELIEAIRTYILKENLSPDFSPGESESIDLREQNIGRQASNAARRRMSADQGLMRRTVLHPGRSILLNVPLSDIEAAFALTIDGTTFRTALETMESRKYLSALLFTARTVLFHSMLPHQKALAVRFLRENFSHRPVVLAVGDEVNDISMIQEADVGIAVRRRANKEVGGVSDFEVSSFAALAPLLLKYGKAAYLKITRLLGLWVYASALPVYLCMIYAYFSDFSGASVMQPIYWILYILLTGVLVLALTLMDSAIPEMEDVSEGESWELHKLESKFSVWTLVLDSATALLHACLIFLFLFLCEEGPINQVGFTSCHDFQTAGFFIVITATTFVHFFLNTEMMNALHVAVAWILLGTLVFTLYVVLEETKDAVVLKIIFGTPLIVIGEVGAVLSTVAASCCISLLSARFEPLAEDFNGNRETSIPELSARMHPVTDSKVTLDQVYRNTPQWRKLGAHSNYKMHRLWLHFSSPIVETEYFHEMTLVGFKKLPGLFFSLALAAHVIFSLTNVKFRLGQVFIYTFTILGVCIAPFFRWNLEIITSLHFLIVTGKFAVELVYTYIDVLSFLLPIEFALYAGMDWRHNAGLQLWNLFTLYYVVVIGSSDAALNTATLFIATVYAISLSVFNYLNEDENRKEFKLLKTTKLRVDRAKDVLHCLFPSFVLRSIWKRQLPLALDQNLVTVLFCDICDFDAICSELKAQELMDLLDDLFKKIDDMCETHGMAKVETVGKTYLACAGLKERENELNQSLKLKSHARRACEMAFEIMTLFKEFTVAGKHLQANIGINSGPVIAGVVGSEKPQFALIGDTVNTASRMSSTAPKPATIQISAETFALLGRSREGISVTPRKVDVKGKGEMEVFLIEEIEGQLARTWSLGHTDHSIRSAKTRTATLNLARGEIFGNWRFSTMMDREAYEAVMAARSATIMQREKEEEKAFRGGAIMRQAARLYCGLAGVVLAALAECALWAAKYAAAPQSELWLQATVLLLLLLLSALFPRLCRLHAFSWMMLAIGFLHSVAVTYSADFYTESQIAHTELLQLLLVVFFFTYGGLFLSHAVILATLLCLYWIGMLGLETGRIRRIEAALAVLAGSIICLFFVYKRQHNLRVFTSFELRVTEQMRKTKELMRRIMPPHVFASLLNEKHKVDELDDVTLVFADIVGFTALSSHKTPSEMVHLLNDLFSGFDLAAARNHVFKVHTIGDCYVAMGYTGVSGGRDRHAECLNILKQACDMIDVIRDVNEEHPGLSLGMRIGVHTGRVIAGITGAKIVRYDIYGPDVLIANKMESNGCAGRIHVSDVTKEMLEKFYPDTFSFEFNKEVEIKSISEVHRGYFITKTSLSPLSVL